MRIARENVEPAGTHSIISAFPAESRIAVRRHLVGDAQQEGLMFPSRQGMFHMRVHGGPVMRRRKEHTGNTSPENNLVVPGQGTQLSPPPDRPPARKQKKLSRYFICSLLSGARPCRAALQHRVEGARLQFFSVRLTNVLQHPRLQLAPGIRHTSPSRMPSQSPLHPLSRNGPGFFWPVPVGEMPDQRLRRLARPRVDVFRQAVVDGINPLPIPIMQGVVVRRRG